MVSSDVHFFFLSLEFTPPKIIKFDALHGTAFKWTSALLEVYG